MVSMRNQNTSSESTDGACVFVVYSLKSASCIVKYGRWSLQYLSGQIVLTRAWTTFAQTVG